MFQVAVGVSALKELVGIVTDLVESKETYDRLEGLRTLLCKLTGKDVPKAGLIALLEEATQGEAYSGVWERVGPKPTPTGNEEQDAVDDCRGRRLRVDGGWIYDIGRGNGIFVPDGK